MKMEVEVMVVGVVDEDGSGGDGGGQVVVMEVVVVDEDGSRGDGGGQVW